MLEIHENIDNLLKILEKIDNFNRVAALKLRYLHEFLFDFNNFWCFENVRVCSFTSKQQVSAVFRACTRKTALCTKKSKIIVKTRVSTFANWTKNPPKIAEIMIISYCSMVSPKRIVSRLC